MSSGFNGVWDPSIDVEHLLALILTPVFFPPFPLDSNSFQYLSWFNRSNYFSWCARNWPSVLVLMVVFWSSIARAHTHTYSQTHKQAVLSYANGLWSTSTLVLCILSSHRERKIVEKNKNANDKVNWMDPTQMNRTWFSGCFFCCCCSARSVCSMNIHTHTLSVPIQWTCTSHNHIFLTAFEMNCSCKLNGTRLLFGFRAIFISIQYST